MRSQNVTINTYVTIVIYKRNPLYTLSTMNNIFHDYSNMIFMIKCDDLVIPEKIHPSPPVMYDFQV